MKLLKDAGVQFKCRTGGGRSQPSSHSRWVKLVQTAAQQGHALVKPRLGDTERSPDIACAMCLQGWCTIGRAESCFTKPCAAQDRQYNLIRSIAYRWKKSTAAKRTRMRKVFKLTPAEVVALKGPSLVCASVNMQGRENAYRLFDYADKTDVFLLQETNMDARESQEFQAYAVKHGYRAWSTEGRAQIDTMGRRIARGGVVTLVNTKSRPFSPPL